MSNEVPIILLIVAIPVYFLTKWILRKSKLGNEKSKKYLAIIPTVVITPLIYAGIITIWILSVSYYPKVDFNEQEWNKNKDERYKMSNDIIKSGILIGKTKDEVIELLGSDFYSYDENHISYDLGFVPGLLNIDPDVLDIYFKKGKVVKNEQHKT